MLVLGGAAMAGAAGLFGFLAQDAIAFFKSPTELVEQQFRPDQLLRVGGLVVDDTHRAEGTVQIFDITDGNGIVKVAFDGVLPDLFREGQGILTEGYWQDGTFNASEVLAKHDENYMPREVADALKKQGHFKPTTDDGS